MIEQTREVVRSFNRTYKTNILQECKTVLPKNEICYRLVGTNGNAKMSKSLGNCIYLSDEPEVIKKKVNSMATAPREINEPGIIEGNVVFIYLEAFATNEYFTKYYPEYMNLDELKQAYLKGGIGDGTIKKFLNNIIQDELEPIRERRKEFAKQIPEIINILKEGTNKAIELSNITLEEVKRAMAIDYFKDDSFLNDQIKKYNN